MQNTEAFDHNISSAVRGILKGAGARLAGRERGPDHAPNRRVPRRNSYEVSDPKAQPWRPIGDGSVRQGLMHTEALIETAEELQHQLWTEFPAAEARRRKRDREDLAREMDTLDAMSPADVPPGCRATLRLAIGKHDDWLAQADGRLRRIDVLILRALLKYVDFATGTLIPELKTIAHRAGVHKNSVVAGLKRLRAHGLVDWVRRTVRTGNAGEFAPQLEQTSNGYEIAPRRRMAKRTAERYLKRLTAKLRRLGALPPGIARPAPVPAEPRDPALRLALASLGASVPNAST